MTYWGQQAVREDAFGKNVGIYRPILWPMAASTLAVSCPWTSVIQNAGTLLADPRK